MEDKIDLEEFGKACVDFFSKVLKIDKPVKLLVQGEHPFGQAAVRLLKNGCEVDGLTEDYDEIEVIIYNLKIRQKFSFGIQSIILVGNVIHELLHAKHPDWDEESVEDKEARLTGLFVDYIKRKYGGKDDYDF